MYGVDDPGLQQILADWARDGDCAAWWAGYADLLPDGAGRYLGLEAAASLVRCYSVQVVPDLLQTRDYAAAVCRAAQPGLAADQVRALVTVIMRRQEIARASLSRVHVVIDEAALPRRIAPAHVMAAQLDHLCAAAARPAVTVQLIALAAPASVLSPPVTVLSLADPAGTDMKVSYGPGGPVVISTRAADARAAVATFSTLAQAALPPDDSMSLVGEAARTYR